jgi:hypothetical protein
MITVAPPSSFGSNQRGAVHDVYHRSDFSDLQFVFNSARHARFNLNPIANESFEAGDFVRDFVSAYRQARQAPVTIGSRGRGARRSCRQVSQSHARAGQVRAVLIFTTPVNVPTVPDCAISAD